MAVSGSSNLSLVLLSVVIATGASYTALDLAGRIRVSSGRTRLAWLILAAVTMGGGIWSMHFVALRLSFASMSVAQRASGAVAMGIAISGMHYTGMAAATFTMREGMAAATETSSLPQINLAIAVAVVTFLVLFSAEVSSMVDRR